MKCECSFIRDCDNRCCDINGLKRDNLLTG